MSDLISRSVLIEHLEENRPINWNDSKSEIQEQYDWDYFINITKAQPTAYDTDKVVEKLENIKNDCKKMTKHRFDLRWKRAIFVIKKAIEIVKGGGTSE